MEWYEKNNTILLITIAVIATLTTCEMPSDNKNVKETSESESSTSEESVTTVL